MTDPVGAPRRSPAPLLGAIGVVLGLGALLVLVAGPLLYRMNALTRGTALGVLPQVATYLGLGGVAVSAAGVAWGALGGRRAWAMVALAGILACGVAAYAPWRFHQNGLSAAHLNDVTTDTEDPPAFEALLPIRAAAKAEPVTYGGAATAALQRAAYPDIVPLHLDLAPPAAFERALDQAKRQGWTVVAADAERGRIEASARTFWYGFTDDVVIRVTADGAGSRVDVRSKSRIGTGDAGTNAVRVRAYLAGLKAAS